MQTNKIKNKKLWHMTKQKNIPIIADRAIKINDSSNNVFITKWKHINQHYIDFQNVVRVAIIKGNVISEWIQKNKTQSNKP